MSKTKGRLLASVSLSLGAFAATLTPLVAGANPEGGQVGVTRPLAHLFVRARQIAFDDEVAGTALGVVHENIMTPAP
jgi:hypothetical protein